MIRVRLKEVICDFEFAHSRRLTLQELADRTGIHRTTLTKIGSPRGTNVTLDNLDRLCGFFGCTIERLLEYVPGVRR